MFHKNIVWCSANSQETLIASIFASEAISQLIVAMIAQKSQKYEKQITWNYGKLPWRALLELRYISRVIFHRFSEKIKSKMKIILGTNSFHFMPSHALVTPFILHFALISISCRLFFYCFALSWFPTKNCGQKRNRVWNCFLPPKKEGAWRLWGRKFPFKLKTCPLVQIREFASGGRN